MEVDPTGPAADRRAFLTAGAATLGAATLGAATLGAVALTAGAADAQATAIGQVPNLYRGFNARMFRQIQENENAHLPAIIATIRALGGTPRPKPNFRNLEAPNIRAFATMSRLFENTGTGAYNGAAPAIFSRQVLASSASIALIEARQAGWLNTLFDALETTSVFGEEQVFERPITPAEVAELFAPYLVDLNGGPPATYSMTPSRANDIAILNFALVDEYLENEFYNLNVPKFFPV